MSLKDKLTRVRDYVSGTGRDEQPLNPVPAPPPLPAAANDFDDDSDRTIYEPDPATVEQIRNLTAGWSPGGAPPPLPTPVATPAPAETPRSSGWPARDGIPLEDIKVDLNNFSPLRSDGSIDFNAVYSRAGLRAPTFGAEQMLQMISELPPEMPNEMKRQTVQVMVNTMGRHMGATPDVIAQDASHKVSALASFVTAYEQKLKETTAGVEAEIASLQALIEEKKRTLQGTTDRLNQIQYQCQGEASRLDDVMSYLNVNAPSLSQKFPTMGAAATDSPSTPDAGNSWESAPSVELQHAMAASAVEDEPDTADTIER